MKLIKMILLLVFYVSFLSCDKPILSPVLYPLNIENNSDGKVYFWLCIVDAPVQYPDTLLPNNKWEIYFYLEANSNDKFELKRSWEEELSDLPSDTLSIFFFDAGVYEDSAWSVIRDDYLILDRYDLSIEDLQALDFIITYP